LVFGLVLENYFEELSMSIVVIVSDVVVSVNVIVIVMSVLLLLLLLLLWSINIIRSLWGWFRFFMCEPNTSPLLS
jgi:hypothetical protein